MFAQYSSTQVRITKQYSFFFLCLFFLGAVAAPLKAFPAAPPAEQRTCLNCHISSSERVESLFDQNKVLKGGEVERGDCVRCHLSLQSIDDKKFKSYQQTYSLEEVNRLLWSQSLSRVPALDAYGGNLGKYDPCGLIKFLRSPVPRGFFSRESMFPLTESQLIKTGLLEKCRSELSFKSTEIESGRKIYDLNGCQNCHGSKAGKELAGPRLRIGVSLLSKDYFFDRIKGTHRKTKLNIEPHLLFSWLGESSEFKRKYSQASRSMPHFGKLKDKDIWDLLAYTATSKEDLPKQYADDENLIISQDKEMLYNEVKARIFDKSCKHCHKNSELLSASSYEIFGSEGRRSVVIALPNSKAGNQKSVLLSEILSPGSKCEDSEIVQRLKTRHLEWAGLLPIDLKEKKRMRGMPLLNSPISYRDIHFLQTWTEQGCPTGKESLCKACR